MLRMEYQPLLRGSSTRSKFPSWTLFLAVCAVGIGGTFQYGYNVSIINAPTQHIHKFLNETWTSRYHKELNPELLTFLWSVIASIFSLGGLCGALIGGSMAIRLGRKGALLMNNIIAILASILMGISFPTGLFELLIAGRFLIGINSGIGICVQPLYLGEVAPKHLRGGMAMGSSIFLTGGILTGQIIGLRELLGAETYWPLLLSSSCFPAFAQLLFLPWFPESPRYLLIDRGDELSCAKALKQFHGSSEYRREMEDIQQECFALDGEKPKKPWQLFTDRGVRWQLITVIVMTMGQQLSGINAIYFYATYIFEQAGISAEKIPYVTLGTGACECLTALTCELYSWVPYVSMTSIFAFILSFGLGPGGITNTLTAELFIQSSRPAAYMIGGTISWISFFTIGMLFPFIVNGLKQYCFLVFLLECSLVAAFIFLVIPETKNKSFLEIKKEFHKLNFGRNTKKKETALYERRQLHDEF
ncbi:PREDICTED: solute carrier family 2, facilitated glucose transporter member 11-like isoform X3 [Haliaeetus leucocephalus]|uniref:solute carrier family 2, facilitated glucose transporter member 11-like isoform X3 n=1 Tax=Haliaeetus leucocephalus TaxID=52644 RepID=UPI000522AF3D|nr:PREDICTED: solute carrier family 2, facilitated glucose transporter member 11-like isoform X2 [Haliaeetus albicilla]XP_010580338.1 PREDICTED: solute carrier family 2, facilitated glucose transporter member 11-like isoform X3 [Haliaeetus leucocephalus]